MYCLATALCSKTKRLAKIQYFEGKFSEDTDASRAEGQGFSFSRSRLVVRLALVYLLARGWLGEHGDEWLSKRVESL